MTQGMTDEQKTSNFSYRIPNGTLHTVKEQGLFVVCDENSTLPRNPIAEKSKHFEIWTTESTLI